MLELRAELGAGSRELGAGSWEQCWASGLASAGASHQSTPAAWTKTLISSIHGNAGRVDHTSLIR